MTSLKITSNQRNNSLTKVGSIKLKVNEIILELEPFSVASLKRNGKEVILYKSSGDRKKIVGQPFLGDEYTIFQESNSEKLVAKIESDVYKPQVFLKNESFNEANNQPKKTTLTVGIVLLFLLIISVFFGLRQKNIKEIEEKNSLLLEEAGKYYQEAENIVNSDKIKSRELFIKAKDIVFKIKETEYKNEELNKLYDLITSNEVNILGEIKVDTSEFLDLSLQIQNFTGQKISATSDEMFIFDTQNKNIVQVNLKTKKASLPVSKNYLDDINDVASYGDRLFGISNDKISELTEDNKDQIVKDWQDDPLFYVYANNVYLVDRSHNKIIRYAGSDTDFSNGREWLAPGITADFSSLKDISIDGSIWLLFSTGKISKYTNGNPISLQNSGLIKPLNNPNAIYTNENLKYVYILDNNESRIVVIEKNGLFKFEYLSDDIKNATDLVVSEEEGKVILLTGSRLVWFGI